MLSYLLYAMEYVNSIQTILRLCNGISNTSSYSYENPISYNYPKPLFYNNFV